MACRKQSIDVERSQIADWFAGRNVFITGASGFMGKVLLEKLLSSCPDIGMVFILLRQKRDVAPDRRLDAIKQMPIFDTLRKSHAARLNKLVAVGGDITLPDLGLSAADIERMSQVSVVFHTAATVKFDDPLKMSVSMNILATQRLVEICKQWPNLESFVHVSTAYCNCDRPLVEERVYPPPADLARLVTTCDCLEPELLDEITAKIIGNRPNTYTFTKAMGEQVIQENAGKFPMAIFRPSIVTAALESPLPGWVDNLNGPTGLIAGAGKGFFRSLYCRRGYVADLVPVDIAINCLIAVAWQTGLDKAKGVKVYNCTTGQQNPITWGQIEEWGQRYLVKHPFDDAFWYPGGSFKGNKYFSYLCVFLFQTLPAYLVDYTAWLLGKKTKFSMVRLQEKLISAITALEFFTTHQWTFHNQNVRALSVRMSAADRRLFDCDVGRIKWEPYIEKYVIGTRKYVLKEEDSNIPKAKSHMLRMTILDRSVKLLLLFLLVRTVLLRSDTARSLAYSCIHTVGALCQHIYGLITGRA